jgi:predicted O-methyltransferase YrrM
VNPFLYYLKFLWKSSNQYAVHSPFIYSFLINGIYQKTNKVWFNNFLKVRKSLLLNKTELVISDFGAGSKIFKDNKRTIAQLTKNVSISKQKAKILFKIFNYFQPLSILELGTCIGLGTYTISVASKNAKIETVEGCENLAAIAQVFLKENKCENTKIYNQLFSDFFKILTQNISYDAVLIDGNHSYKATLDYFKAINLHIHNDSFIVFDDIHWSKEMNQAWEEIIQNKSVTISIDFFYFGIIFFRKEQEKQHFVLRS